ncbi:hypothetical protein Pmani_008117 [Petrolisthes manimaculis]|uniref:Uncharacterized protein n=1 Tax=Petrolisthes manimaculis TaxID=1843537 RepID=A0AAE1Q9B8_9EUCA|nr:hypothetical protein Pmani_008117 [Petrolisthes manimaculis]
MTTVRNRMSPSSCRSTTTPPRGSHILRNLGALHQPTEEQKYQAVVRALPLEVFTCIKQALAASEERGSYTTIKKNCLQDLPTWSSKKRCDMIDASPQPSCRRCSS